MSLLGEDAFEILARLSLLASATYTSAVAQRKMSDLVCALLRLQRLLERLAGRLEQPLLRKGDPAVHKQQRCGVVLVLDVVGEVNDIVVAASL